jgi:transposase
LGKSQDLTPSSLQERELLRKDKALAETAALLVLSKKLSAIFPGGADE